MKSKFLFLFSIMLLVFALGCNKKEVSDKSASVVGSEKIMEDAKIAGLLPLPEGPKILEGNSSSKEKLELGKMLYFEPRISKSQLISCNTCHNVSFGGGDYQETSIGHGWAKGPRNAPTVFNSVYNTSQFWDGRAKDLAEQAKGPIQASVEMAATPEHVIEVLNSIPAYVEAFKVAFPGETNPVTFDNLAKAIEIFEATLVTPDSKIDKYLKGDINILSPVEKEGLAIFVEKGCTNCHTGVNFGGDGFFPFGVFEKPSADILTNDKGRFQLTSSQDDEFAFKAPTLRNIELTAPYFHSGKVWSLEESVALMSSSQLGSELTSDEVTKLVAVLKAMTGVQPVITAPLLPASTNSTPKPVWK